MEQEKKPIYKKWWFWLIIIIILLAIGGSANNQNTNVITSNENTTNVTIPEKPTNTKVTLEQYNQIKDGMTYDEVIAIFGMKENGSSESEIAGIKSEIKTWNGNGTISVVTIGFTNGKVSSKSQTGLE